MAKTRASKETAVERITDKLRAGKAVVFADFTGLLVKEMRELRVELRRAGVYYEVVKKTILKRALQKAGLKAAEVDNLQGSISLAVGMDDEVAPAKILAAFAKTHDKLRLLGGIIENNFVAESKVKSLAQLPARTELLGQLVGALQSPLNGLIQVLAGNLRGLVQVLKAAAEKGQQ
jgi:large subunit ribosomal protein L10